MRFTVGNRVRVAKSVMPEYIGLEGVIVSRRRDAYAIFNSYTLKTDEGEVVEFLEFQLELVKRSDESASAP